MRMEKQPKPTKNWLNKLVDADMVFWLMPPLMLLLVFGTLAQRWLGLWPAIDQYFSTYIIWLGPIPLPGAYILLGILGLNLLLKFILKSDWRMGKSGIILSHLGALILLFGGLLTAMTARETFLVVIEGQSNAHSYSYSDREFLIFENDELIKTLPFEDRADWDLSGLPFEINIKKSCENCNIIRREESPLFDSEKTYYSMAQFMAFEDKPLDAQPETNLPGLEFDISGIEESGSYIAFDGMPEPVTIENDGNTYRLFLVKARHELPFEIYLKDFVEERYDGTEMAKTYHSDIIVKDGDVEWPYRIEMNKPLTYRGYTFFQSSFQRGENYEATVLAVVENKGRLFPYIGTLIMSIGLLLHCLIATSVRSRGNQ